MAHFTKRNEPPATFIPKHETHATEALKQRQSTHAVKLGMVAQRLRQAVIGNAAAKVVHMMRADVRREPAQNSRQVVIGASLQSRFVQAPFPVMGPERILELVLHVEQPDPDRA